MASKLPIIPGIPATALEAMWVMETYVKPSAVNHYDFYAKGESFLAGIREVFPEAQIERAYGRLCKDGL